MCIRDRIKRETFPAPKVRLNPEVKDFYQFTTDDLIVENYQDVYKRQADGRTSGNSGNSKTAV